ncbi:MAG: hypothetical protein LBS31_08500 [Candidatus Adiutrix sp.]|jgi:hypothetical protein|nr:hypothetical protein [Candidatus Adiutrix sp.]
MENVDSKISQGLEALKETKMTGGDDLNPVYRDAFLVHASLTEIMIDFGNLNKSSLDGQASARERLVLCPAVAMKLAESLQAGLSALRKRVGEMAREQRQALEEEDHD